MNNIWLKFIKRVLSYAITLFLLVSLIFILIRIAPGDPVQRFISPDLSPSIAVKMKTVFALDKPLIEQYGKFMVNLFTGDFGFSYNHRAPVTSVIWTALPFTLIFSLMSFVLQISIAALLVIFISKRRGALIDRMLGKLSLIIYSVPTMIIGLGLIYIFSISLNLLPSSDLRSINYIELSAFERAVDYIIHMILPLATLSLPGIVIFYNYLRSNIETTYQKNFVLFLRANGLNEKEIFNKHILPNSIRPLISILGIELGVLLGGALITETIFSLPGMGRLTVNAILMRDYPLVVGSVFTSGIFVLAANLFADLIKIKLDKNIKTEYL